jgi:SnoaL-like protein
VRFAEHVCHLGKQTSRQIPVSWSEAPDLPRRVLLKRHIGLAAVMVVVSKLTPHPPVHDGVKVCRRSFHGDGNRGSRCTLAGENVTFEQRVTNVYRRDAGTWKIVHHHTDLSSGMVDLLARLQKKA